MIFFFFQTLRIRNKNTQLFYTVSDVIEKGKVDYVLHMKCTIFL